MYFYSNPKSTMPKTQKDQDSEADKYEFQIDLECEVFEIVKNIEDEQINEIVVHLYFGSDATKEQTNISTMFINRTDFNEQYFKLIFDPELEFLEIRKNQMYFREQDLLADEMDTPLIKNEIQFDNFRA